jgi:hypothetical protein
MTDDENAVEIREAVVAVAEQLEGLNVIAERVDTLNSTATRIAVALEQLVRQHHAASQASYGIAYRHALAEAERG